MTNFQERFLDFLRHEKRASEHTCRAYETDLDQFEKYLLFQYDISPENAEPPMVRSWVVSLVNEGLSPSSVARKIATTRAFYKFLRKRGLVQIDPVIGIKIPKRPKRPPSFVSSEGMEKVLEATNFDDSDAGLRDRLILEMFYGAGIRLAELISLKVGDADLDQKLLKVMGKRSKERLVPLTNPLVELLRNYLAGRTSVADELFLTDSGKKLYPVFVRRLVKKKLSGFTTLQQKSPHILRHTFATHLLNRGADLNSIKELLGHSSLAATQVYTHNVIEKLKKSHRQAHPKG